MKLWRIARAAFAELDGEGARLYGGRWNSEGLGVVYLSTSLALAALEYLVHVEVSMVPSDLISVELEVPDRVSRERVEVSALPEDWNTSSDHPICVDMGNAWVGQGQSCLLFVPSAVIPNSWNVLLNPLHPDGKYIQHRIERFAFDRRLLR